MHTATPILQTFYAFLHTGTPKGPFIISTGWRGGAVIWFVFDKTRG